MNARTPEFAAPMRRFAGPERSSAVVRYFIFTALWSLCMAAAVFVITPKATVKIEATAAAAHPMLLR